MSLRSRLHKLERTVPARDPLEDDPQYQLWRLFYEAALEVMVPFPEARQEVERRIGVNEPLIFRPDWQRTVTGVDVRFYFCKETLWAALEKFPEARQALDQALVEAFGDKGADGGQSPV
jgi:hypothetical protein